MHPQLKQAFDAEMSLARACLGRRQLDAAFQHLERAHVLGQAHVVPHVRSHLGMLRVGLLRRDSREVLGQLFRIPAAVIGSALGRVPVGNTGGANVDPFRPMPIAPDLQALLDLDRRPALR